MERFKFQLLANYDDLTDAESGIQVEYVLDYLRRDNAVEADEYEDIMTGSNSRVRAEKLLEILLEKNETAFSHFCTALSKNYPHFLDQMENTLMDSTDGVSVRPPMRRPQLSSGLTSNVLPAKSALFVGRKRERENCLHWLQDTESPHRLYSFIGPPGVGKTALLVTSCHDYIHNSLSADSSSRCRLLFFDLRCIQMVEDLAFDILIILQQSPLGSPIRQVYNYFRACSTNVVLVLDNAEDLMKENSRDKFVDFVNQILRVSSRVRVLITSRVSIKSLDTVTTEVRLSPLDELDGPALARRLVPSLKPHIAKRVCDLTGNLPLGIHLLSILLQGGDNPEELITALEETPDSMLNVLQSVEGVPSSAQIVPCFASCFDRLDEPQQNCIVACSVFPTTFDRKAAQAVFSSLTPSMPEALALVRTQQQLRCLVDRSLLMFDEKSHRYSVHPLLRTFYQEMVRSKVKDVDSQELKRCFCDYYIKFAQSTNNLFYERNSCSSAVQTFWSERQNIVHAIQLCISTRTLVKMLLPFASRKGIEFLRITLPEKLIEQVYETILGVLEDHEMEDRSMVLTALAFYARVVKHDSARSLEFIEEANTIQVDCKVQDAVERTFCLHSRAKTFAVLGRYREAEEIAKQSMLLSVKHHDERERVWLQGLSVEALAGVHRNEFLQTKDEEKAKMSSMEYDTVLKYIDKYCGDHIFSRYIYWSHGELRQQVGDLNGALDSYKKALQVQNIVMGDCIDQAMVHFHIGNVQEQLNNIDESLESFQTAFDICYKIFGLSEKTRACGQRLISLLRRKDFTERADSLDTMLNES